MIYVQPDPEIYIFCTLFCIAIISPSGTFVTDRRRGCGACTVEIMHVCAEISLDNLRLKRL